MESPVTKVTQTCLVAQVSHIRSKEEIEKWFSAVLTDLLDLKAEEIDTQISFDRYGLDSSSAIGITDALGTWLGRILAPTLLYDYPTIEAVASHLTEARPESG